MDWSSKRALVTGAGGFIGSHLTERLVDLGARTRALVHYNSANSWGWLDTSPLRGRIEVVAGDVCDPEGLREALDGVDVVFHLAALIAIPYSYRAPRSYVRTNVEGTLNLLQGARDAGVERVVHTSSSEVYGTARRVPIDEDHPLQGQSPYSASKIGADKLAEAFSLSYGLPVVTVRPFNAYGPRQSARAVIPTIVTQALCGTEIRLGEVRPTRDFNYVADTVAGFVAAAESREAVGQVINLGTGEETSIEEVARAILGLTGKELPIVRDEERVRPAASEVDRLCADPSRARDLLGWQPAHTLEQGLSETIAWIRENLDRYRVGRYTT
jgi:dTDP-glucose 4,6-dehydratase